MLKSILIWATLHIAERHIQTRDWSCGPHMATTMPISPYLVSMGNCSVETRSHCAAGHNPSTCQSSLLMPVTLPLQLHPSVMPARAASPETPISSASKLSFAASGFTLCPLTCFSATQLPLPSESNFQLWRSLSGPTHQRCPLFCTCYSVLGRGSASRTKEAFVRSSHCAVVSVSV